MARASMRWVIFVCFPTACHFPPNLVLANSHPPLPRYKPTTNQGGSRLMYFFQDVKAAKQNFLNCCSCCIIPHLRGEAISAPFHMYELRHPWLASAAVNSSGESMPFLPPRERNQLCSLGIPATYGFKLVIPGQQQTLFFSFFGRLRSRPAMFFLCNSPSSKFDCLPILTYPLASVPPPPIEILWDALEKTLQRTDCPIKILAKD